MLIAIGYLLVLAAMVVFAAVARARVLGPDRAPAVDPQAVPIEELALLAGGPSRAAVASALRLYEAGTLTPGSWRAHLSVTGPVPPGCHEISLAVHDLVGRDSRTSTTQPGLDRGVSIVRLQRELGASPAIRATQGRLVAAGLVPAPDQAHRSRMLRLLLLAFVGLGVLLVPVTFVADAAGVALLLPAIVAAGILAIPVTATPPTTRMGRNLLAAARTRAAAFAAGGLPGQRAVAFALFGPPAVWRADPALAHQLGLGPAWPARSRSARRSSGSSWWDGIGGGSCGGGGSDSGGGGGGGGGCGGGGGGGGGGCGGGGG